MITKFAPAHAPYIGRGRWTWQISTLNDKNLIQEIIKKGIPHLKELERLASLPSQESKAILPCWEAFKEDLRQIAKKYGNKAQSKVHQKIKNIENDIQELNNHPEADSDDNVRANEAFMASELAHLERINACDIRDDTRALLAHEGEKLGGIWSKINTDPKP